MLPVVGLNTHILQKTVVCLWNIGYYKVCLGAIIRLLHYYSTVYSVYIKQHQICAALTPCERSPTETGGFPRKVLVTRIMFPMLPRHEQCRGILKCFHDDVIKWKHFQCHWPFVRGIHRSPPNSPHKGQWRRVLIFCLICTLNKWLSKQSWGW